MMYKVTKQFGINGAASEIGQFKSIEEARTFIQEQLRNDANLNIKNVIYKILEGVDEVETYDSNAAIELLAQSGGGRSQSSTVTFNPTPLNTAPRPAGIPHNWVKDKKDK